MKKNAMRIGSIGLFMLGQSFLLPSSVSALSSCPEFPFLQPTTGALAAVNCDFHRQYEKRVTQVTSTFGAPNGRPVFFDIAGELTLKRNGESRTVNTAPSPFNELKSCGHGAFAVFITLSQQAPDVPWGDETQSALSDLLTHLTSAKAELADLGLTPEDRSLCEELVSVTEGYLNEVLSTRRYSQSELTSFYERARPSLSAVIARAAEVELRILDETVTAWLGEMTPAERGQVGGVIVASHQARAREIAVQYFQKKLGFQVGEGAQLENGVVILEGRFDVESASAQLARHYIDREAGQSIFQDPGRLQIDALATAAEEFMRGVATGN